VGTGIAGGKIDRFLQKIRRGRASTELVCHVFLIRADKFEVLLVLENVLQARRVFVVMLHKNHRAAFALVGTGGVGVFLGAKNTGER